MAKDVRNFMVIGVILVFFYAVSLFYYGTNFADTPFRNYATVFAVIFCLLAVGSAAVVARKEWGRRLLVSMNIAMVIFVVGSQLLRPGYIPVGYALLSLFAAIFFNQKKIQYQFQTDIKSIRKSVLVIDDDEGLQKTIKKILLPNGYSVLTATTGEKGLQVAKAQQPDLIVLDVILPGIKGREVCSKLKEEEQTKGIPVIFLTAKDSQDDIIAEMEAGAMSHLTKPVDAKVLLSEIKRVLG